MPDRSSSVGNVVGREAVQRVAICRSIKNMWILEKVFFVLYGGIVEEVECFNIVKVLGVVACGRSHDKNDDSVVLYGVNEGRYVGDE